MIKKVIVGAVFIGILLFIFGTYAKADDDTDSSQPPFTLSVDENPATKAKTIDLFLKEEIVGPEAYIYLSEALQTLTPTDVVKVHLYGYGGDVQGGTVIMNGLLKTKAHVIILVEAPIYSMDALIACSGDEIRLDKGTYLMYHDASVQMKGKVSEIETALKEFQIADKALFEVCVSKHILTEQEVLNIMTGTDIYIDKNEVDKRVKN